MPRCPDFVAFPTELSYRTVTRVNVRTSQRPGVGVLHEFEGDVRIMADDTIVTSFDVAVPAPMVRFRPAWQWLAAGWRDLTRAPRSA